jgi:predicted DCC family thiol-disulfide oxidoreductase YuxK
MTDFNNRPILLFDGVCNLCNGAVQWVIRHDPEGKIYFAPLQSEMGQQLLRQAGLPKEELSTIVLYLNGHLYTRSDAALQVLKQLGGLWGLLYVKLKFIPRPIRDAAYDWIARNRYRWFGKRESCMVPTPELKARFLS